MDGPTASNGAIDSIAVLGVSADDRPALIGEIDRLIGRLEAGSPTDAHAMAVELARRPRG